MFNHLIAEKRPRWQPFSWFMDVTSGSRKNYELRRALQVRGRAWRDGAVVRPCNADACIRNP